MATAKAKDSGQSFPLSELIERLSSILMRDGKGNPRRLTLQSLEAAYAKQYDAFRRSGHGKFKKFVATHFVLNDKDQVTTKSEHSSTRKIYGGQSTTDSLAPQCEQPIGREPETASLSSGGLQRRGRVDAPVEPRRDWNIAKKPQTGNHN